MVFFRFNTFWTHYGPTFRLFWMYIERKNLITLFHIMYTKLFWFWTQQMLQCYSNSYLYTFTKLVRRQIMEQGQYKHRSPWPPARTGQPLVFSIQEENITTLTGCDFKAYCKTVFPPAIWGFPAPHPPNSQKVRIYPQISVFNSKFYVTVYIVFILGIPAPFP